MDSVASHVRADPRFEGLFNTWRRPRTNENNGVPSSLSFNISNALLPVLPVAGPSQSLDPHSQFAYPHISYLARSPANVPYSYPSLVLSRLIDLMPHVVYIFTQYNILRNVQFILFPVLTTKATTNRETAFVK
jgi:hypothetical protein